LISTLELWFGQDPELPKQEIPIAIEKGLWEASKHDAQNDIAIAGANNHYTKTYDKNSSVIVPSNLLHTIRRLK
jgi:hypothetical protein